MMRRLLFIIFAFTINICAFSKNLNGNNSDTLEVFFRQGQSVWLPGYMGNEESLKNFLNRFQQLHSDKLFNRISKIHIAAGCSPEGSWAKNQNLSKRRADVMRGVLKSYIPLPDSVIVVDSRGINWAELRNLVVSDSKMPYKDEVLNHLDNSPEIVERADGKIVETRKLRLMYLGDGIPWKYMYNKFFPVLRSFNLSIVVEWEKLEAVKLEIKKEEVDTIPAIAHTINPPLEYEYVLYPREEEEHPRPFYMSLKTNLLYDLALVPNAGIEFYLGNNWSVNGNYMHAWWKNDAIHWYWRIYGGELGLKKWFGRAADEKPLTGHHLGVFGQVLTYDIELGGRGYMGGLPGGTLKDRASYGAGLEYGYSHPIGKRLNLDMTIGGGYLGGEYREYIPVDDCYVWQVTKRRHWFGPTKAEISLVWLLGRGNENKGKRER